MPTRLIRRVRGATASRDSGITLMEVLVASTLSLILGMMTIAIFLNVNTTASATTDRTISTADARQTVQAWAAYLRVADGTTAGSRSNRLEWFSSSDILFYADITNRTMAAPGTTTAPAMVWLRRDSANNLVEELFASTAAQGASPTRCRVLVRNVSASVIPDPKDSTKTVTLPLFGAYDYSENAMVPGTGSGQLDLGAAPAPTSGCQALPVTVPSQSKKPDTNAQSNLQNVFSISIDFTVLDTKNQHPIAFSSQAFLPSLGGV